MSKMVLALDLGTRTGVARGRIGEPPASVAFSTWHMPSGGADKVGEFAAAFMAQIKQGVADVDVVVFEAPIMVGGGKKKFRPDVVRRFYGMAFVIEGVCNIRDLPCAEVSIGALKKQFAGHGRAEKSEMILAARRRGFQVSNEHEADAAACWYAAVSELQPKSLHLYDPDFRGLFGGGK